MPAHLRRCYAPRLVVLVAVVLSSVAVGFGVGSAQAADPNFDLADAALEKAYALVSFSESGPLDDKAQKDFDRAKARALADIEEARAEIAAAIAAADSP